MRSQRPGLLVAALLAITLGVLPRAFAEKDAQGFVITKPSELKYMPNETGSGPDIAVIYGDPTKEGLYIIRARFKPGVMSKPHTHPTDRHVTVISGTWCVGMGERFDANGCRDMGPGSFIFIPKGMRHFAVAKGDVVQVHGVGPFTIHWVR